MPHNAGEGPSGCIAGGPLLLCIVQRICGG